MINAYDLTLFAVFCCAFSTMFWAYTNMRKYKNVLERSKKEKTFVETITHDLKTPTNAQIRALDLLLENTFGELKSEQREIIKEIKNSCRYMNTLIYSILDAYKSEGRYLSPETFNFTLLVEESIREISYLAGEKEQRISFIKPQNPVFIFGDKTRIKRVIINLISNAIRYGRKNTVIETEVREEKNLLNFTVKNHAKYIEKEKLGLLFEKYKTYGTEKTGNGLGLFLSKQIIQAHKGKMSASSDENNVCTFGFTIPENCGSEKNEKLAC